MQVIPPEGQFKEIVILNADTNQDRVIDPTEWTAYLLTLEIIIDRVQKEQIAFNLWREGKRIERDEATARFLLLQQKHEPDEIIEAN